MWPHSGISILCHHSAPCVSSSCSLSVCVCFFKTFSLFLFPPPTTITRRTLHLYIFFFLTEREIAECGFFQRGERASTAWPRAMRSTEENPLISRLSRENIFSILITYFYTFCCWCTQLNPLTFRRCAQAKQSGLFYFSLFSVCIIAFLLKKKKSNMKR